MLALPASNYLDLRAFRTQMSIGDIWGDINRVFGDEPDAVS